MKVQSSDNRFFDIYNCEIEAVYRKIPFVYAVWCIDVMYKNTTEDLFHEHKIIYLQDDSFIHDMLKQYKLYLKYKDTDDIYVKCDMLKFAFGGQDIDIYLVKNNNIIEFIIKWSPNSGLYVRFHFNEESYLKLINLINSHKEELKHNTVFSMFSKTYKIV